jgi:hypothetical protein
VGQPPDSQIKVPQDEDENGAPGPNLKLPQASHHHQPYAQNKNGQQSQLNFEKGSGYEKGPEQWNPRQTKNYK